MNTLSTFNEMFKEYMYTGALGEADFKKYYLIERYRNKVSQRLLNEQKELLKEGEVEFSRILGEMIKGPSLLDLIEKDGNWGGGCFHQPVVLGLEHGVTFESKK